MWVGLGVGTVGTLLAAFFLGRSVPEGPLGAVAKVSPFVGLVSVVFLGGGLHDLVWRPGRGESVPPFGRGLVTVLLTVAAYNVLLRIGLVVALLGGAR
ncbi:MAG TPA: hypothetical protein VLS93_11005 [Anaeromyxobacteraceae bacterium]|nr:hypothetical protein [Anaeromyxobacteraceae bacterium]